MIYFSKIILLILIVGTSLTSKAEPLTIKIGASLPLSGNLAFAGQDIRRGLELAVEELQEPSFKFELIFDDNQHEARHASSSAHKLIEIEKVDLLISLWDMADVIAPLAERRAIPHITIRWDPGVAEKFQHTMTFESTYRSWTDSTLKLLQALNVKSISLFTEDTHGWLAGRDYLKEASSKFGIEILSEELFQSGTSDLRTTILRGLKSNPDYILLFTNPPNTDNIIKIIQQIAPKKKATGYFEIVQDLKLIEGLPFVAQFEATAWFDETFKKRYGENHKSRAAQAYDIVKLLTVATLQNMTKPTIKNIVAAVALMNSGGASGKLFLTGERTIEIECVWKISENGILKRYPAP